MLSGTELLLLHLAHSRIMCGNISYLVDMRIPFKHVLRSILVTTLTQ
jgi:hypothetical protein